MRRREFITLSAARRRWPLVAARAQQPAMPVIGYPHVGSPEPSVNLVAAFEVVAVKWEEFEGQNIAVQHPARAMIHRRDWPPISSTATSQPSPR